MPENQGKRWEPENQADVHVPTKHTMMEKGLIVKLCRFWMGRRDICVLYQCMAYCMVLCSWYIFGCADELSHEIGYPEMDSLRFGKVFCVFAVLMSLAGRSAFLGCIHLYSAWYFAFWLRR
jgi:hypothetical protein